MTPIETGSTLVQRKTCDALHDMAQGRQFLTNFQDYGETETFLKNAGVTFLEPDPQVAEEMMEWYLAVNPRSRVVKILALKGQIRDYLSGQPYELDDTMMFEVIIPNDRGEQNAKSWAHFYTTQITREQLG